MFLVRFWAPVNSLPLSISSSSSFPFTSIKKGSDWWEISPVMTDSNNIFIFWYNGGRLILLLGFIICAFLSQWPFFPCTPLSPYHKYLPSKIKLILLLAGKLWCAKKNKKKRKKVLYNANKNDGKLASIWKFNSIFSSGCNYSWNKVLMVIPLCIHRNPHLPI